MSDNLNKLKAILREMFQLDQADLDFGIYRIMNQKRDEIEQFLNGDLLPQVKTAFAGFEGDDLKSVRDEMDKLKKTLEDAGVVAETTPKYQALQAKLSQSVDVGALENEVFSQLTNFFRRYYQGGDFLSLRRYKAGVYAIPYEGEEVKLHWANADQYYIKSSENFRDYTFKLPSGKRAHFKLVDASTEQNNKKEQAGKERRFVLCEESPLVDDGGELFIRFEYKVDEGNAKQAALNTAAVQSVLSAAGEEWKRELAAPAPTESNPRRTLLEKHLTDYTAKYSFDYFIHKDLGGFLRRELDFFIKNEILFIDDLDADHVRASISKVKVIKEIGHKVIAFLEQLENFQKKLWLKKKFVVETGYCCTLDKVPEELYPAIISNTAQVEEWKRLFAIQDIQGNLHTPAYSVPLSIEFLKANPFLVIDTAFFDRGFTEKLLAAFDNLDNSCDGVVVNSDNFQALGLIAKKYRGRVQCIHIDPPYNTQTSGFLYRNAYKHSSWLAMMHACTSSALDLLTSDGAFLCHIDENENERLHILFDEYALQNGGTIIWDKRNPMLGRKGVATQHEYVLWRTNLTSPLYFRNANQKLILNAAKKIIEKHGGVTEQAREEFAKWITGCKNFSGGEKANRYINDDGRVYQSAGMAAPEQRTDPKFFVPLIHPKTGKECPVPAYGWSRTPETHNDLLERDEIIFGDTHNVQPRRKVFLTEDSQRQVSSVIQEAGRGKTDVDKLGLEFPYCHPLSLYVELVGAAASNNDSITLDFFAGSGTNAHAVIALNREEETNRKYILVEMGNHFDSVLKPRIQKVIYSKDWNNGKPVSREGSSHLFKYIRLESYEDALNNLHLKRTPEQGSLLDQHDKLREQYMLSYMLDVESAGSASLLNVSAFADPFNYRMNIARGNETKETVVDLVETFNWLLGIKVLRISQKDYRTAEFDSDAEGRLQIAGRPRTCAADEGWTFQDVEGETLAGDKVLIIWRTLTENPEKDNVMLDSWFSKRNYNTLDFEFSRIYVNGDNNLENLKIGEERWKVALIEQEFKRLMFDVEGV